MQHRPLQIYVTTHVSEPRLFAFLSTLVVFNREPGTVELRI